MFKVQNCAKCENVHKSGSAKLPKVQKWVLAPPDFCMLLFMEENPLAPICMIGNPSRGLVVSAPPLLTSGEMAIINQT